MTAPAVLASFLGLALPLAAQSPADPVSVARPGGKVRPPQRESVHFAAIGDYGTTEPGSFAVAALVRALEPQFVITLGDNNYENGAAATIDANIGQHYHEFIGNYAGSYGAGSPIQRFYPTLGNHDWRTVGALPYLAYFTLPGNERYYDFRRGPVHFFALDSDDSEPDGITADSVQAAWLEARLAASDAPFKVVFMHHAPYCSSSNHGSHGDLQWPFREWGASIVLTGHDHLYERLSVSGFPYLVNGLGGKSRYPFGPAVGGSQLRFAGADGATWIDADDEVMRLRFLSAADEVMDDYVLPRGGVDVEVTPLVAEGSAWRYLDTGVDPGAGWTLAGFDDSAWELGNAELGYGDGDETTVVDFGGNPNARHITTWFRGTFSVASPAAFDELQLRVEYDDGAVVYVNGVEVARGNLPAGAITASTLASAAIGEERTFFPFVFEPSVLVAGTNQLAVEIHQSSANSSDISFDLELVGLGGGTTVLARGSNWRYLDTGVDPGPSFAAPAFDDSGWLVGPAQFGYGEGDEATVVDFGGDPLDRHRTTWFRTTFTVADASAVDWLECLLLRDDGLIVYLNGSEAVRFNLPRTGVTASTLAPFNVTGADENVRERTSLDPRLLVSGTNTLAVELHNSAPTSSDLSFDLELVTH